MSALTPLWAKLDGGYAVGFAAFGALLAGLLGAGLGVGWPWAIALAAALAAVHAVVCRSAEHISRVNPLRSSRLPVTLSTFAAAASAAGIAFAALAIGGVALVSDLPTDEVADALPAFFGYGAGAYLVTAAYCYASAARREALRFEARALEAELLAVEADLRALSAKLNPHFLFNALNSIAALAARDPDASRRMCVALADHMRLQLRAGDAAYHPLEAEVAIARGYLAIERFRFGDRMSVVEAIGAETLAWPVPPLVLQPLVDNAVKHGVAATSDPATIALEARVERGVLVLTVENPLVTAPAPRAPREGLGLELVRRRLAAVYGGRASMDIAADAGRFRAVLTLPKPGGGGA
jgi:two-component system, LytTR family, sensor histidine kinase AlgZ